MGPGDTSSSPSYPRLTSSSSSSAFADTASKALDAENPEAGRFADLGLPKGQLDGLRRTSASQSPTEVTINLDELTARIKGNNVALRNLAARLRETGDWNANSLGPILDKLAPLVARKDDLKLIRECVPLQQRTHLGELESGGDLISTLGSRIAQARTQVEQGKFQGTSAERKAELEQLDKLSRKLAGLVFSER